MDEFNKCRFCMNYDECEGCRDYFCSSIDHISYHMDVRKIIAKSKELGISVTDVLNLIKECN
jgi:hypothetical protein